MFQLIENKEEKNCYDENFFLVQKHRRVINN